MSFNAVNLGLLPGGSSSGALGCSHDGSIVVGFAVDSGGQQQAVYWDAGGIIHILSGTTGPGSSAAVACSSDGTVIVGNLNGAGVVTWSGGSYATVTHLPALGIGFFAQAFGCSADASIIVGQSDGSILGNPETAVVWTNGVIAALPFVSGGNNAAAVACNSAGTILAGDSNDGPGNFHAVKWTGGPGWTLTTLNSLSGSPSDQVNASNSDSSVLAGSILSGASIDASTWSGVTPTVLAGPVGGSGSSVLGSDSTGNILCGVSASGVAAVWFSGTGAVLAAFVGAVSVDQASAVSSDASTIVGFGTDGSHRQTAVKWTVGAPPLVWFRLNTGAWLPNGDPATQTGGISLAPISGDALFATVQGTGDAGITLNAGNAPFVGSVPSGFTAGLPHSGGGFTTLDPTKLFGSAGLSGGNRTASFITTPGVAQSVDGYTSGQYYFELANPTGDIFSAFWGGGVGRNFNSGGDFNRWFNLGGFTNVDNNGGAIVSNESLGQPLATIGALNAVIQANAFSFPIGSGDVVGVALFISPSGIVGTATLADLFFSATPSFVDFTEEPLRRRFIYINGGAQNLQPDGSGPLAVTPPVFLSLEGAGAPNTFAQNKGRGGDFSIAGPDLTAGASNPPGTSSSIETAAGTIPFSSVLGDYLTGNIYAFNQATLTDNGSPRKWVRRWRALPNQTTSTITFSYLAIDMETGIGVPPGTNPQLVLRWSDDGGKSWAGNRIIPVGATGATSFTVKFNRLGSTGRFGGSTRIFELSSTDPFKVSIISAEVLVK